jgi:hypothetical protein
MIIIFVQGLSLRRRSILEVWVCFPRNIPIFFMEWWWLDLPIYTSKVNYLHWPKYSELVCVCSIQDFCMLLHKYYHIIVSFPKSSCSTQMSCSRDGHFGCMPGKQPRQCGRRIGFACDEFRIYIVPLPMTYVATSLPLFHELVDIIIQRYWWATFLRCAGSGCCILYCLMQMLFCFVPHH